MTCGSRHFTESREVLVKVAITSAQLSERSDQAPRPCGHIFSADWLIMRVVMRPNVPPV